MRNLLMNLGAFVSLPIWFILFVKWFWGGSLIYNLPLTIILMVLTLVIHEAIHIITIKIIQPETEVKIGIRRPLSLYVMIYVGTLPVAPRLVFLLAPLVMLTFLFGILSILVPAISMTMVVLATINAAGSFSDIARTVTLLTTPKAKAVL